MDEKHLESLNAIGCALHPHLIPDRNHPLYSNSNEAFAEINSIVELERQDTTPLRQLLHGISTGEKFTQDNNIKQSAYAQKERSSIFTAADIIRTAKGGGPNGSKFKDLISNHLNASGSNDHMKTLLSHIGVSRAKTFLNFSQDVATTKMIKKGYKVKGKGFGLLIGAYDNIGFRKRAGFMQFIMMSLLYYPPTTLIKLRIYPDPRNNNYDAAISNCISRDRFDWDEVKEDYKFSITKEDALLLAAEVTLPSIQYVLDLMKDGSLPSLESARTYVEGEGNTTINTKIPHSAIARRTVAEAADDVIAQIDLDEDQVGSVNDLDDDYLDNKRKATIYDTNNCVVDTPFSEDLNSTQAVMGVADYYTTVADRCLDATHGCEVPEANVDEDSTTAQPQPTTDDDDIEVDLEGNPWADAGWPEDKWPTAYMQQYGPFICGDGSPTFALISLQEKDPRYRNRRYQAMNGGFHGNMENHKMMGQMFGLVYLIELISSWRDTEAKQQWILNPGDPNQKEDEMKMWYIAQIEAAVLALLEHRKANDESNDIRDVSAMDVYNFLIGEGTKSPIAHAILTEMRFAEVIFLLHQAEEESNAKKYVTGMKFGCLLYIGNHCTKYVRMCADFLKKWHCMSEADRVIFEQLVMTRKTKADKNIYTDRFVEWLVRDTREGVGKQYTRGTEKALQRQAMLLNMKKTLGSIFKKDTGEEEEDKNLTSSRKLSSIYSKSLLFYVDNKIFTDTSDARMCIAEGKDRINPEMLDMIVTCEDKMDRYIDVNFKQEDIEVKDQKKINTKLLKRIQPTEGVQKEDDKNNLARSVSTTPNFLKDQYTVNELKVEYNRLTSIFEENERVDEDIPAVKKPKNKGEYCDAIVEAREILIQKIDKWKDTEEARIRKEITTRDNSAAEGVADRLSEARAHPFYHMHVENSNLVDLYSKKITISSSYGGIEQQEGEGLSQESTTSGFGDLDLDNLDL